MALNEIIYQALLVVGASLFVTILISYISHKNKKIDRRNTGNFYFPTDHMKSIRKTFQHSNPQHLHESSQLNYRDGILFRIETGEQFIGNKNFDATDKIHYTPRNQANGGIYYSKPLFGPNNNPVWFK